MKLSFDALPLRWKMTLAALTPLVVILLLVSFAASWLIGAWIVGETQKRVRHDLNAAREVLSHETSRVEDIVRFTAHTTAARASLSGDRNGKATGELAQVLRREGLDLLTLTDPQGNVVLRAANLEAEGGVPAPLPLPLPAEKEEIFSGTLLLDAGELAREGEALALRARVAALSPFSGGGENRGMVLVAASAVRAPDGRLLGYLYGGVLLNRNLPLVDRIQQIVYGDETFHGIETGSATIFLEDLRVATTIRLQEGQRALGTRVSAEVAEAVLERGETWLARAKVVDAWYLTAYEPILDPGGRPIGALYVGLLEAPFTALKNRASLALFGLLLLGSAIGYLVARHVAGRVSRPILELEASAHRIAAGEREVILPVPGGDEVGDLTQSFNDMTFALKRHEEELNRLNRVLERKVAERTAELEEKSLELIRTQQELLRAEKLAAVGELASGVAHEINNPAAIIRGNVEILLGSLPADHPSREEAEEVLKQTERIALITANMLSFAREQAVHPEQVQLNVLIEEILAQASHQAPTEGVKIARRLEADLPPVEGDRERLRQVFTNIIVNALQALNGTGVLAVETRLKDSGVEIAVADTGPGVDPGLREKIFNPFFTTKASGTGLGLSVSYGIVQAHGGTISVESPEAGGTIFRVRLPLQLSRS